MQALEGGKSPFSAAELTRVVFSQGPDTDRPVRRRFGDFAAAGKAARCPQMVRLPTDRLHMTCPDSQIAPKNRHSAPGNVLPWSTPPLMENR